MPNFQSRDYILALKMFLTNPKVAFEPSAKVNRKIRRLNDFNWVDNSKIEVREVEAR